MSSAMLGFHRPRRTGADARPLYCAYGAVTLLIAFALAAGRWP